MLSIADKKLLKFILVGIVNTLVGTAIMFGLYNLCGCSYWISSAANYVLASVLSYVLNKRFTFGYKGDIASSGVRFALNIAICYLIAYGVAKPLVIWFLGEASMRSQENVAMLVGMCIFTGLNYIGQRFFVFGEKDMQYENEYEIWLKSPHIDEEDKQRLLSMNEEDKKECFYKTLEFGTAGMRGRMGLGPNRVNKYTIRLAAKVLADMLGVGARVAIAYDTRNNSQSFAEEAAKVLAEEGIKVYLFDRYSPVPLLSFTVRELGCDAGIVITASHNTKEYNGFKVYDNTGCQMRPEFTKKIADNIDAIADKLSIGASDEDVHREDCHNHNIEFIGDEVCDKFIKNVLKCSTGAESSFKDNLRVVYTPIHGSGRDFVTKALAEGGFENVSMVETQADFNGSFPTVRKPNPEDEEALSMAAEVALEKDADIIIGTDPDCDRIGVAVRDGEQIKYLTGNQMGALLVEFLAEQGVQEGKTLITSIVTGELGAEIARSYGINVIKTLTGFKYIGSIMNSMKDDEFFMGYEESYGYLVGNYARDKDAVSAALVICEIAAYYKSKDMMLTEVLELLYKKYGYFLDKQESFEFDGISGHEKMTEIMKNLRKTGKRIFQNSASSNIIKSFLDYSEGIEGLPKADILKYVMHDGSWIAVRPSGTEPKIKIYYCIKGKSEAEANNIYQDISVVFTKLLES